MEKPLTFFQYLLNSGIPNAIKVFEELKKQGHKPVGIRLDSGDLAYLSIQAAMMLNDAGFPDTRIVLSNQLDEKDGKPVESQPSIEDMRRLCRQDLARLDPGVKRLISPHIYHVSVSGKLWDLKYKLIHSVKKET